MSAEVIPITPRYGATPEDWAHFQFVLGLTADLLPVVSNPHAVISPESKMKAIGKTPSLYNNRGEAVGISGWTALVPTHKQIAAWSTQRDYGICIQTRTVRAIDVDVTTAETAERIRNTISSFTVAEGVLPTRLRSGSSKFLCAFVLPGELPKRILRTADGNIEFLATGQQFVAVGTHPSGTRYEWQGGLPDDIPELTPDQFEALWTALEAEFATEPGTTTKASTKAQQLTEAVNADPVAQHLIRNGWVKSRERDGRLHVRCPWEAEHTTESADSATSYFPAHTGGYQQGHFHCMHAHCAGRSDEEFLHAVGLSEFEVLLEASEVDGETRPLKYPARAAQDMARVDSPPDIIKGVLPMGSVGAIFGESGSGKTFATLDMVAAIAQGVEWRGRKVRQGRVLYVVAEGAGGFRKRLKAYMHQNNIDELNVWGIEAAPNFMHAGEATEVARTAKHIGGVSVIVVDTLAQVMPGGDENGGKDMGPVLANCRKLHEVTGAMVLLVAHSGKDASRGLRGWSGTKAALDVEIEVTRSEDMRSLTVTKMKDGDGEGAEFGFKLLPVVLGVDEDGDDITSCVVAHSDGRVKGKARGPRGAHERLLLRVLGDLKAAHEKVGVGELLDVAVNELPFDAHANKRDRRREVLMRSLDALRDAGRVRTQGGMVEVEE